MSEMVSPRHELSDAEALTTRLIGDTTTAPDSHDRMTGSEQVTDDFTCCSPGGEHNPSQTPAEDPFSDLTPAGVFLAITHNNGLTDKLPANWETTFDVWWDHTQGDLALIRTALNAAAYVTSTGANIPDLLVYMNATILDITQWVSAGDEQPWNVHAFEARALGNLLTGLDQIDPGAYTHPFHQLVHTALRNAEEHSVTGVYGWLCHTHTMGHPTAPYTLNQLHHLAEGGTI